MIIDGNEIEKRAMEEFHKGNRKEGLRIQEEFAAAFRTEYAQKDHCSCTVVIMETARNASPFTEPIRNMCQTVCAL